ncbi:hypothetical protein BJP62_05910 [Jeongeupia sp. USM3]|nr:hypothetical protein BJP62_05910 [Jeongeupia sp. USM3]
MSEMLRQAGVAEVLTFADAASACEKLATMPQGSVDLIVLDLQMPEMDGIEFIHWLRHWGAAAPRLIVTSAHDAQLLDVAVRLARDYGVPVLGGLSKPISALKLQALLRQSVDALPDVSGQQPRSPRLGLSEIGPAIAAGQFVPYYQPKVCLKHGRIVGAEMLARWQHPQHGVLAPAAFAAVFDDVPLLSALTDALVAQLMADLQAWQAAGCAVPVSINCDWPMLQDLAMPDRLLGLARLHGVAPALLELEITESARPAASAVALGNLVRLRLAGVGVVLDDFGNGFANLRWLGELPLTHVKLDRSLVHDAAGNARATQLLDSAMRMAQRLQLTTVVEGVERLADLALAKAVGCDQVQGAIFSMPVPADELLAQIRQRAPQSPV